MGALTGDRAWFDDAVKQVLQFHAHLWDPQVGLYAHGRHMNQPLNPEFYWARANGWAMLASVELLDVLPEDHPGRGKSARGAAGAHPERGEAPVGHERAVAPDARQAGLVPRDLGLGHLRLLHRPGDQRGLDLTGELRLRGAGRLDRRHHAREREGPGGGHVRRDDARERPRLLLQPPAVGVRDARLRAGAAGGRRDDPPAAEPGRRRPVQAADLPLRPASRPAQRRSPEP